MAPLRARLEHVLRNPRPESRRERLMDIDPRFLMLVAIVAVALVLLFGGRRGGPDVRRVCGTCGTAHPSFARFCRKCGKKL